MQLVETQIFDGLTAHERLEQLQLNHESLMRVLQMAISAKNDSTDNDPMNAKGTFAYIYGIRGLRDEFVGKGWELERPDSVEAIFNRELMIRVTFQNVDVACDLERLPAPRSKKGPGSERVCQGNLFPDEPQWSSQPDEKIATYYLMLGQNEAGELARPVVVNGFFKSFIERIFVSKDDPFELKRLEKSEDQLSIDDFDVNVTRKI